MPEFFKIQRVFIHFLKICFCIKDDIQMSETGDFLEAVWYIGCKIRLHVIFSVTAEGSITLAQLEEIGINQTEGLIP